MYIYLSSSELLSMDNALQKYDKYEINSRACALTFNLHLNNCLYPRRRVISMAPSEQYLPLTPKKLVAMFGGEVKGWFK